MITPWATNGSGAVARRTLGVALVSVLLIWKGKQTRIDLAPSSQTPSSSSPQCPEGHVGHASNSCTRASMDAYQELCRKPNDETANHWLFPDWERCCDCCPIVRTDSRRRAVSQHPWRNDRADGRAHRLHGRGTKTVTGSPYSGQIWLMSSPLTSWTPAGQRCAWSEPSPSRKWEPPNRSCSRRPNRQYQLISDNDSRFCLHKRNRELHRERIPDAARPIPFTTFTRFVCWRQTGEVADRQNGNSFRLASRKRIKNGSDIATID